MLNHMLQSHMANMTRMKSVDRAFGQFWKYKPQTIFPHNSERALMNWEKLRKVLFNYGI